MNLIFAYTAVSRTGQVIAARGGAPSRADLLRQLSEQELDLVSCRIELLATLSSVSKGRRVGRPSLIDLFAYLKSLVGMGLHLNAALESVADSLDDMQVRRILGDVRGMIDKGYSLSDAMERTGAFPRLALASIRAGEQSGTLERVFGDLAMHYRRIQDLVNNARKAAAYPVIALLVLTSVLTMMLVVVIPQLKDVLPPVVPWPTRFMLWLSENVALLLVPLLVGPVAGWFFYRRLNQDGRAKIWSNLYKVPVLGRITLNIELATLFMNLSMLSSGGVPLMSSIETATTSTTSEFLRQRLEAAQTLISQGGTLSDSLRDPLFPPIVSRAVMHAEATGGYAEQFARIAEFLRERTSNQIQFASTFIEPILLLIGGGMLMLMAMSVFLPIYGQLQTLGR